MNIRQIEWAAHNKACPEVHQAHHLLLFEFFSSYGVASAAVHPKIPEPPEATRAPFNTVKAHRLDANQYGISR